MKYILLSLILIISMSMPSYAGGLGQLEQATKLMCMDQWPDSLQMQDYCFYTQEKYGYVIAAYASTLTDHSVAIIRVIECVGLYTHKDYHTADWELVYQCVTSEQ